MRKTLLVVAAIVIPGGSILLLAELARRAGLFEKAKKQIARMRKTK